MTILNGALNRYWVLGQAQFAWLKFAGVISMIFTGTVLSSGLAFVTQILLARSLEASAFGRLSVVLVAINFFTPVGSVGVNWLLLRVFGQEGWQAERWLRPAALLVCSTTVASAAGLLAYLATSGVLTSLSPVVLVGAVLILFGQIGVDLGSSSFQIEDRYRALTLLQAAPQAGRFVIVALMALGAMLSEDHVITGYGLLGLGLSVVAVRSLLDLRRKARGHRAPGAAAVARIRDLFGEASPFAFMTLFYVIYFQGGLVLVERLAGSRAAAEYNASSLVFAALSLIPNVIYMKFLAAKICRWAEHDRKTFVAVFHIGVPAMAACGGILAILLVLLAHPLTAVLYGGKYGDAATLVMIRAIAVPISFAQMTYSSLFISKTEMIRKVSYLGTTAVVAVVANLILVSAYGVAGAAMSAVIAETVLLVLHMVGASKHIGGIDIRATPRLGTLRASVRHLLHQDRVDPADPAAVKSE